MSTKLVIQLLRKAGVDRAVFFSVLAQGWGVVAGPVTVVIVTSFLNPVQQGYYYTFYSLLNMKMMFDLGLSQVSVQLVSKSVSQDEQDGKNKGKSNTRSVISFIKKWYVATGTLMLLVLNFVGFQLFQGANDDLNWQAPWVFLVFMVVLDYVSNPLLSVSIGAGYVSDVTKIRLFIRIMIQICLWTGLLFGFGLFAIGMGLLGGVIVRLLLFNEQLRTKLRNVVNTHLTPERMNWRKDVMPFQLKVSVAWLGGYFAFQGTIPLVFHFYGPETAGAYGITIALASMVLNVCLSWLVTKAPYFTRLIVQKKWGKLRNIFSTSLAQASSVSVVLVFILTSLIYFLQKYDIELGERFLDVDDVVIIMLAVNLTLISSSIATLIRSFGDDPFFYLTFIAGICNLFCVVIVSKLGHFDVLPLLLLGIQILLILPLTIVLAFRWLSNVERPVFCRNIV